MPNFSLPNRCRLLSTLIAALSLTLTACDDAGSAHAPGDNVDQSAVASTAPGTQSAAGFRLLISPEDLITLDDHMLTAGPSITGTIQPERRADLRAEVAAVVLKVQVENGESVRRGDLLVQLDDTEIRDNLNSAESMERAASYAYEQAKRQLERLETLRTSGLVSKEAVEDGEVKLNQLRGDFESSKSRLTQARQQLQRTEVRAPFDGIVSDRKVSVGDTSQIGKELVNVVDLGSLRFEGLISAEDAGVVKTGQKVVFRVHGYAGQDFVGTVARINPLADAATRQVEVLVDFADAKHQPKLAGLYTEGHINVGDRRLTIPATVLVRRGDTAIAWRVVGKRLEKVSVDIGKRDPRSGEFELKSGLEIGDKLLRYPTAKLKDGQAIELALAGSESDAK